MVVTLQPPVLECSPHYNQQASTLPQWILTLCNTAAKAEFELVTLRVWPTKRLQPSRWVGAILLCHGRAEREDRGLSRSRALRIPPMVMGGRPEAAAIGATDRARSRPAFPCGPPSRAVCRGHRGPPIRPSRESYGFAAMRSHRTSTAESS